MHYRNITDLLEIVTTTSASKKHYFGGGGKNIIVEKRSRSTLFQSIITITHIYIT